MISSRASIRAVFFSLLRLLFSEETRFQAKHMQFPAMPNDGAANENLFAAAGKYLWFNDGMDYPWR